MGFPQRRATCARIAASTYGCRPQARSTRGSSSAARRRETSLSTARAQLRCRGPLNASACPGHKASTNDPPTIVLVSSLCSASQVVNIAATGTAIHPPPSDRETAMSVRFSITRTAGSGRKRSLVRSVLHHRRPPRAWQQAANEPRARTSRACRKLTLSTKHLVIVRRTSRV